MHFGAGVMPDKFDGIMHARLRSRTFCMTRIAKLGG